MTIPADNVHYKVTVISAKKKKPIKHNKLLNYYYFHQTWWYSYVYSGLYFYGDFSCEFNEMQPQSVLTSCILVPSLYRRTGIKA